MSTFTYTFHGVGDRVVDTLLVYALSDLAKRADAKVTLHWNLGHDVILTLQSSRSDLQGKMFMALRKASKSYTLANRLRFWLNVGGGKGGGWSVDPIACVYCSGKKKAKNILAIRRAIVVLLASRHILSSFAILMSSQQLI